MPCHAMPPAILVLGMKTVVPSHIDSHKKDSIGGTRLEAVFPWPLMASWLRSEKVGWLNEVTFNGYTRRISEKGVCVHAAKTVDLQSKPRSGGFRYRRPEW